MSPAVHNASLDLKICVSFLLVCYDVQWLHRANACLSNASEMFLEDVYTDAESFEHSYIYLFCICLLCVYVYVCVCVCVYIYIYYFSVIFSHFWIFIFVLSKLFN